MSYAKDDWNFANFGEGQRLWSEDPLIVRFFERMQADADHDRAEMARKNAARREIFRRSPAMAAAFPSLLPESEADFDRGLKMLTRAYSIDPMLLRYVNHLEHSAAPHANTEWWHAFGHQRLACLSTANAYTREEFLKVGDIQRRSMPVIWDSRLYPLADSTPMMLKGVGPREMSFEMVGRIDEAQTYLWTQECLEAAVAAPLVPHAVVPNAVPFDNLFFSFEMAAWIEQANVEDWDENPLKAGGLHAETWWVTITKLGDAGMAFLIQKQLWPHAEGWQPQEHILFEPIAWGSRWPEDFEGRRSALEISYLLRMLSFMQAPFVDAQPQTRRASRPMRRDYERAGKVAPEPQVSIVTLRRPLHEPLFTVPQEGENGSSREYKHSWWVGGHYRWQYYPSTNDHKLIPIAPYMKQIGKPLLPRLHHVKQ